MSTHTIQIIVDAQDKASAAIKDVEQSISGLGEKAKSIGKGMLTGIFSNDAAIKRAAREFDKSMHTNFEPVIEGLLDAEDLIAPFGGAIAGGLKGAMTRAAASDAWQSATVGLTSAIATVLTSGLATQLRNALPDLIKGIFGGAGVAFDVSQLFSDTQTRTDHLKALAESFGDSLMGEIDKSLSRKPEVNPITGFVTNITPAATAGGTDTGQAFIDGWNKKVADQAIWDKSAQSITGDLASALQGNTDVIKTAMDKVQYAITHPMELAAAEAQIQGALTTLEYKRGLASNTDEVNKIIDQQMADLRDQWEKITGHAYDAGAAAAAAWNRGYANRGGYKGVGDPEDRGHHHSPPPGQLPPMHHLAGGGFAAAGTTAWVGEYGPEKVTFGQNAYVTPNAGGQPIQIFLDGRKIFDVVNERLGKRMALTGSGAYTRG